MVSCFAAPQWGHVSTDFRTGAFIANSLMRALRSMEASPSSLKVTWTIHMLRPAPFMIADRIALFSYNRAP